MHLFQPKGLALRLWSLLLASGLSLMAAPPHAGQDCAARTLRAWADPSPGRIFVVAHRADWRNFPENSLAAIDGSIALGVDAAEIDLQLTKDGVLIVLHDATVDRTTTGQGRIGDLTLQEAKALRLRDGLGSPTVHTVPTLRETLNHVSGRIVLNLDKGYRHLAQVMPLLEELKATRQVILKGPQPVAELKAQHGEVWNRFAYMPVANFDRAGALDFVREWVTHATPCAVEIVFSRWDANVEEAFRICRGAGVRIWINTLWPHLCGGRSDDRALDDPEDVYGWFIERGVTVFQTDRPRQLMEFLSERSRNDPR